MFTLWDRFVRNHEFNITRRHEKLSNSVLKSKYNLNLVKPLVILDHVYFPKRCGWLHPEDLVVIPTCETH